MPLGCGGASRRIPSQRSQTYGFAELGMFTGVITGTYSATLLSLSILLTVARSTLIGIITGVLGLAAMAQIVCLSTIIRLDGPRPAIAGVEPDITITGMIISGDCPDAIDVIWDSSTIIAWPEIISSIIAWSIGLAETIGMMARLLLLIS